MNFTIDDRARSIRRFVMNALGAPPWTVRVQRVPVPDEERPVAIVEPASPAVTTRWRTTIPQGDIEKQQTFSIACYPAMVTDDGPLSAAATSHVARQTAETLDQAFAVGLVNDDGSMLTPPRMVPVYDFAGVPVEGPGRAGAAEPYGWMTVEDAPVSAIPDPDDHLRWTVACDVRLSWSQGGRVRAPEEVAAAMPGSFDAGG